MKVKSGSSAETPVIAKGTTIELAEPIFQPQASEDFDASELGLTDESNDTAVVTPVEVGVPSTNEDLTPPVAIGPEHVHAVPDASGYPFRKGPTGEMCTCTTATPPATTAAGIPPKILKAGSSPTATCTSI